MEMSLQDSENSSDHHSQSSRSSPCHMYHLELSPSHAHLGMPPRNFSTPKRVSTLRGIIEEEVADSLSSGSYSFKRLPKFTTPPSQIRDFVATNPFDAELRNKLHLPIFSPSVFEKCVSPSKELQDSFCWTIDDVSRIHPAPIEEQFIESDQVFSPETESRTQQAIKSYFCTTQVLQSPWPPQLMRKTQSLLAETDDKAARREDGVDLDCSRKLFERDVWTQTELSLPPILPASVEEALRPFFNFNQDQQHSSDCDDSSCLNASTTSVRRRKLFEVDDDDDISPVNSGSPPGRGILLMSGNSVHVFGTPVASRSHGSPLGHETSPTLSPIRASPIATRLDFSEEGMAVDSDSSQQLSEEDDHMVTSLAEKACSEVGTGAASPWRTRTVHIVSSTPAKP